PRPCAGCWQRSSSRSPMACSTCDASFSSCRFCPWATSQAPGLTLWRKRRGCSASNDASQRTSTYRSTRGERDRVPFREAFRPEALRPGGVRTSAKSLVCAHDSRISPTELLALRFRRRPPAALGGQEGQQSHCALPAADACHSAADGADSRGGHQPALLGQYVS